MKLSLIETASKLVEDMESISKILRSIEHGADVEISTDETYSSIVIAPLNEVIAEGLKSRLAAIRTELKEMGIEIDYDPGEVVDVEEQFALAVKKMEAA